MQKQALDEHKICLQKVAALQTKLECRDREMAKLLEALREAIAKLEARHVNG